MTVERRGLAALLLAACAACGTPEEPAVEGADAGGAAPAFRYAREYVFLGARADTPVVAPFAFQATPVDGSIDREIRGWLARGATWDPYLDESFSSERSSGVWRVLPHGPLRVAAGGATEIESLWFRLGARRLRLDLEAPLSDWTAGEEVRYRVDRARLTLGDESLPGVALEVLRIDRAEAAPGASDALLVTGGDSLRLLVSESLEADGAGRGLAWLRTPEGERSWESAEVRWLEVVPYEAARRDLPVRWSFRVPEAGLEGEVESLGFAPVLGEERGGRRRVEARFTVRGWVERDGVRTEVVGVLRHQQR